MLSISVRISRPEIDEDVPSQVLLYNIRIVMNRTNGVHLFLVQKDLVDGPEILTVILDNPTDNQSIRLPDFMRWFFKQDNFCAAKRHRHVFFLVTCMCVCVNKKCTTLKEKFLNKVEETKSKEQAEAEVVPSSSSVKFKFLKFS